MATRCKIFFFLLCRIHINRIMKFNNNFMTDSKIDKHIQQLILIQLGLQKKSEQIFKQLLNQKPKIDDPLSDIIKGIQQKNLRIQNLSKQVQILNQQNKRLKKGIPGHQQPKQDKPDALNFSLKKIDEYRSHSLPPKHQQIMKEIQEKKKSVQQHKQQYKQQAQKFIIFLIHCIKEVSKKDINQKQDIQKLVKNLQNQLEKQRDRVLQLTNNNQKGKQKSIFKSSQSDAPAANKNLEVLIKKIKNNDNKQVVFKSISQALGLQQEWNSFMQNSKQQSEMLNSLKKILNIDPKSKQQIIKKGSSLFKNNIQLLNFTEDVKNSTSELKAKNYVEQIFNKQRESINSTYMNAANLLSRSIAQFYKKLDQMFCKHNQHPYRMSSRQQFAKISEKLVIQIKDKQWQSAFQSVQSELNQAFYMIQRRTKFHSANRILLRNKL